MDRQGMGDGGSIALSAREVGDLLRHGRCPSEEAFDNFLPQELRAVSSRHWTPLFVAHRITEWINILEIETLVDIGSGAGKFCVAAALGSRCHFTGIEQRPRLVHTARALAREFGVEKRVEILEGEFPKNIPGAQAYYLFNPFGENLSDPDGHLDEDVELGGERYDRDVADMVQFFEQAPVGTYVIKYNGFGAHMPRGFEEIFVDREMPNVLRTWRKTRPS